MKSHLVPRVLLIQGTVSLARQVATMDPGMLGCSQKCGGRVSPRPDFSHWSAL
jgi:hypothetical protein